MLSSQLSDFVEWSCFAIEFCLVFGEVVLRYRYDGTKVTKYNARISDVFYLIRCAPTRF